MSNPQPKTTPIENLLDGVHIQVTYKDEMAAQDSVKVRRVPLKHLDKLQAVVGGDVEGEAAVYLDMTREAVDGLTDSSVLDVVEKGRELNEANFTRWVRLQRQTLRFYGQDGKVEQVMREAAEKVLSQKA